MRWALHYPSTAGFIIARENSLGILAKMDVFFDCSNLTAGIFGTSRSLETRIAPHCPALPRIASHCPALPRIAPHCPALPHIAPHCAAVSLIVQPLRQKSFSGLVLTKSGVSFSFWPIRNFAYLTAWQRNNFYKNIISIPFPPCRGCWYIFFVLLWILSIHESIKHYKGKKHQQINCINLDEWESKKVSIVFDVV